MISLYERATPEVFDEEAYLLANPDVAAAASGRAGFGRKHLADFGLAEGRMQLRRPAFREIAGSRWDKLERLQLDLERRTFDFLGVDFDALSVADPRLPVPFERVSSHEYDREVCDMVDADPGALYLDIGAGLRPTYRSNVVYADIAALPTCDVLCFGEALPFASATFDGVICIAVLEHVPDPTTVAAEMVRVTRPGGRLIVDWPFLQPVHGYPQHYFNATEQGAREVFERLGAQVQSWVPPHLHPVHTLRWLLDEWRAALPQPARDEFLHLTPADVLSTTAPQLMAQPWAQALPRGAHARISAGTRVSVVKPLR